MSRLSRLWRMFYTMLYISAFTFGGGFVIVSLMKKKYVDEFGWLTEEEMLDLTALAQSSPGAIAVNAAILTGYRLEGIPGVIASVLGTVIPPVTTLSIISLCYGIFRDSPLVQAVLKGMQAGVAAVITDVTLSLGQGVMRQRSPFHITLLTVSLVLVLYTSVSPALLLLCAALLGGLWSFCLQKGGRL